MLQRIWRGESRQAFFVALISNRSAVLQQTQDGRIRTTGQERRRPASLYRQAGKLTGRTFPESAHRAHSGRAFLIVPTDTGQTAELNFMIPSPFQKDPTMSMNSWLSSLKPSRRQRRQRTLHVELLERRDLLTVFVDLGDIVGGGDGSGTGDYNAGIDPRTGEFKPANASWMGDGTAGATAFDPVASNTLIDGVFVPNGATTIATTGLSFTFPATVGLSWDGIRNGVSTLERNNYINPIFNENGQIITAGVGIHANSGITFDLDALRDTGFEIEFFTGNVGGISGSLACGSGTAIAHVLLDGVNVFSEQVGNTAAQSTVFSIPISPMQQFLTLATTDMGWYGCDKAYFGNAKLLGDDSNQTPTITSNGGGATAGVNVAENTTAVTNVESSDPEGETENGGGLTYSLSGPDEAMFSIDAAGNLIFVTAPNFENPGDVGGNNIYDVTVTVTDSGLLTDSQDIAITVDNVNEAPSVDNLIDDVMVNEDQLDSVLDLSNTFSDPDGDTLTLIATSANALLVTATMVGTDLVLDYQPNQSGTTTVTVRATDPGELFEEDTLTVTVVSAEDQLVNLIGGLNELQDQGVVSNGNANALTSKLENALAQVNAGNPTPAANQVNAVVNQVEAFRKSGKLSDDQADDLIEQLEALLTSLLEG